MYGFIVNWLELVWSSFLFHQLFIIFFIFFHLLFFYLFLVVCLLHTTFSSSFFSDFDITSPLGQNLLISYVAWQLKYSMNIFTVIKRMLSLPIGNWKFSHLYSLCKALSSYYSMSRSENVKLTWNELPNLSCVLIICFHIYDLLQLHGK